MSAWGREEGLSSAWPPGRAEEASLLIHSRMARRRASVSLTWRSTALCLKAQ